jgi:hypothetical protein
MDGIDVNTRQLKAKIKALPPIEDGPRFSWLARRKAIRSHILNEDPEEFMRWSTVREFLHTGIVPHVKDELADMKILPLNRNRTKRGIAVPDFGSPLTKLEGGTGTSIQQMYYLSHWEAYSGIAVEDMVDVMPVWIHEIGGGYGAMALVCWNLGYRGLYTIDDLPEMKLLQEYYLSNVIHQRLPDRADSMAIKQLEEFGKIPDLVVAMFSVSEIPPDARDVPDAKSYLFGYQTAWGGWDNTKWFDAFAESHPELRWYGYANPHFTDHRFLIGV